MSLFNKDIELNIPDLTDKISMSSFVNYNIYMEQFLKHILLSNNNPYFDFYKKIYNSLEDNVYLNYEIEHNTVETAHFILHDRGCNNSPGENYINIQIYLINKFKKDPKLYEKLNMLLGLYKLGIDDNSSKELENEVFYKIYEYIVVYIRNIVFNINYEYNSDFNTIFDIKDKISYSIYKYYNDPGQSINNLDMTFILDDCQYYLLHNKGLRTDSFIRYNSTLFGLKIDLRGLIS